MGIFNGSNDGSLLIGDYIRQHMEYGIIMIIIIHQLAIPFLTRWVVAVDTKTKILFCLLGVSKNEVLAGDRQTTKGVESLSWLQQIKYFTILEGFHWIFPSS